MITVFDNQDFVANASESIVIHGAREHNLKNLSLSIPRNQFIVITGVSGSGKSTLAFDLLFAEGQRRFLDSMNVYARQFVEQMSRPDVDLIAGMPPTVSIEQRTSRGGGKSTVATVTEIYHFVRLLFARLGVQYCPDCQLPVESQTRDELIVHLKSEWKKRGNLLLLAPVIRNRKGFHTDVAEWAARHGYAFVRADGKLHSTGDPLRLDRFREHNVEVLIASLGVAPDNLKGLTIVHPKRSRSNSASPSLELIVDETLKIGNGSLLAMDSTGHTSVHSTQRACPDCGKSFEPLDPKDFSYNSPQGWCPKCRGFGEIFYLPDVDRGARADAIEESWYDWQEDTRETCTECNGARLNRLARSVRLPLSGPRPDKRLQPTIDTFSSLSVSEASRMLKHVKFGDRAGLISRDILPEIRERLKFLDEVGLGYLQLGRGVPTLSGGESQRIRLAAQLGSNLSGVLYILDEPTIGLHPRDNDHLLRALEKLKRRGNSVIVVEHDEETMKRADQIIDLGPGAGIHGGSVVASGKLKDLLKHPESITGNCLRAQKLHPTRGLRRPVNGARVQANGRAKPINGKTSAQEKNPSWLILKHASKNNLKDVTLKIPLGRLVLLTGVSGSGKSTLVRECLLPELTRALKSPKSKSEGEYPGNLTGWKAIQSVYEVDQSPIGRTPRSIPATYVGFFDDIRQLFAQVPEARLRGYLPGRFSFNSPHGRCPECEGAGNIKLEMNFLPPAYVRCEACQGCRFNRETLDIEYAGKNIAQVLEFSVEEAMEFFRSLPKIKRALQALCDTGLGYLKLGQVSPTLSGGEAQRVKLVSHLLTGLKEPDLFEPVRRNLFILEEPTIGLHMADVQRLVDVLQRLVDAGHSVVVIEHNLDLIAEADWIIDLGPEGGEGGGKVIAEGTPEEISGNLASHTGRFLRQMLRSR